jgi:hypothetical protein
MRFRKFLSLCNRGRINRESGLAQALKAHIAGPHQDGPARGSRERFLREYFGLFFSNINWQEKNYNLRLPMVCDNEHIRL